MTTTTAHLEAWGERSRRKFWTRVEKTDGCWQWRGSVTGYGYGQYGHGLPGLTMRVHKLAWEAQNGPVPVGLVLDHLCRNRLCVRPDHLQAVPNRVNVLRGEGLSAVNARKRHCRRGHPFSDRDADGRRRCEQCERIKYEARLIRDRERRSVVLCGHPLPFGDNCTRKIALGNRCPNHDVWNRGGRL